MDILLIHALTQSQLSAFIRLHSKPNPELIGGNTVSPEELEYARRLHSERNRAAFEADKSVQNNDSL